MGSSYIPPGGGGGSGGTVTSVGLSAPASVFSVSGSPVTSAGTLAFAFGNQPAASVLSGPQSGTDDQPVFRSLVASDIPDLSSVYLKPDGNGSQLSGITPAQIGAAPANHVHLYPVDISYDTYTLEFSSTDKWMRCSNSGGCVITVPPQSDVAWDIGAEVAIEQTTVGQVTVIPGSGVTINCSAGYTLATAQQYAVIMLKRTQTTNVWTLTGERVAV